MEVAMQLGVMAKKIHKATYRFSDSVKRAVSTLAQIDGRSENQQVEYLIKLGSLVHERIEPTKLSPKQIADQLEQLFGAEETSIYLEILASTPEL